MSNEINQVVRDAIALIITFSRLKGVLLSREIGCVPSALSHWLHGKNTLSEKKVEALFYAIGLHLDTTSQTILFLSDSESVVTRKWFVPDSKQQLFKRLLPLMPELATPNKIHLSKHGGPAVIDLTISLPGDLTDPRGPSSLFLAMSEAQIREIWSQKCRIDIDAEKFYPRNMSAAWYSRRGAQPFRPDNGNHLSADPDPSSEDIEKHQIEHSGQTLPSVGDVLKRWGQSLLVAEQNDITPEIAEMLFRDFGNMTPKQRLQKMKGHF
jgi:hypothetical protein